MTELKKMVEALRVPKRKSRFDVARERWAKRKPGEDGVRVLKFKSIKDGFDYEFEDDGPFSDQKDWSEVPPNPQRQAVIHALGLRDDPKDRRSNLVYVLADAETVKELDREPLYDSRISKPVDPKLFEEGHAALIKAHQDNRNKIEIDAAAEAQRIRAESRREQATLVRDVVDALRDEDKPKGRKGGAHAE